MSWFAWIDRRVSGSSILERIGAGRYVSCSTACGHDLVARQLERAVWIGTDRPDAFLSAAIADEIDAVVRAPVRRQVCAVSISHTLAIRAITVHRPDILLA